MSEISGYPRQMPSRYAKWLPRFTGTDEENIEDHMSDFWDFFQLHPINDDVEYLAMKLFLATLHDDARRWYDGLPNSSITYMDQLEEFFLMKMECQRGCHNNSLEAIVMFLSFSSSSI
jgi:hypothetical protein